MNEKCMLCSGEIGEGAHGLGVCVRCPARGYPGHVECDICPPEELAKNQEPTWEQDWERDFPASAREAKQDNGKSTRATLSRDAYKHGHAAGRRGRPT